MSLLTGGINLAKVRMNLLRVRILGLRNLHRDQRGSISIVSVFSILFLAMMLGLIMNIGKHADRKARMQNGADAATYTGGVVVARGMNTVSFTNHLLCDVFALTAYLREARDLRSEVFANEVLDHWEEMSGVLGDAPHSKLSILDSAISTKVELERNFIAIFSVQNQAVSEQLLPVMETILYEEMIPIFQEELVPSIPGLANEAANEIAGRHGPAGGGLTGGHDMVAMMWRSDAFPFDGDTEAERSTLPAVDPVNDTSPDQPTYFHQAVLERAAYSRLYLLQLNNEMLLDFSTIERYFARNENSPRYQPMLAQFWGLWRGVTRANLKYLLEIEFPDRNLPFQLRLNPGLTTNDYLDYEFMFVGVSYWRPMQEELPGLFVNPIDSDDITFAQTKLFIPRSRPVWRRTLWDPEREYPPPFIVESPWVWFPGGRGISSERSLMNQNWAVRLVPATHPATIDILEQSHPYVETIPPYLGGISVEEFRRINTH